MKKFIIAVFFVVVVPICSFSATGEEFKVKGYNVEISASKLSGCLVVRCQINGGESTDQLHLDFTVIDDHGRLVNVKYTLDNYSHSDKFSIKEPLENGGNSWKVLDIKILN